ncbi:MAG: hypothetical protein KBT20_03025 [Bacteroidales bacterium]|nr:hypothetical protein [Candidatus Liminaster caballi]
MRSDYIGTDSAGYPYNRKYPPYKNSLYHGYKNDVEETFFYDFAVQNYSVTFVYKEKRYYLMTNNDYVFESDASLQVELQKFEDGNSALEQFLIDGKRLIDLLGEIIDCEPL